MEELLAVIFTVCMLGATASFALLYIVNKSSKPNTDYPVIKKQVNYYKK